MTNDNQLTLQISGFVVKEGDWVYCTYVKQNGDIGKSDGPIVEITNGKAYFKNMIDNMKFEIINVFEVDTS